MNTYKKLFKEIYNFKIYFIVSMICGIVMSLSAAQVPIRVKPLVDNMISSPASEIYISALFILGFYLIHLLSRYYHMFYNQYLSDCISVELRRKLNSKFLKLDMAYVNRLDSGSSTLISRILNDVGQVEYGIGLFADFFREPILIIYLIVWLFILDWKLTLMAIFILPIIFLFLRRIGQSLRKYSHRSQEELESLTGVVKETLDGMRVIQSFNLQNEMSRRFNVFADKYLRARRMIHSRTELSGPVTEAIAALMIVGLFVYMGGQISQGSATMGDFMSFVTSLFMLQKPIKKMQESYVKFQRTNAAAERVFAIIEAQEEIRDPLEPQEFPKNWQSIIFDRVSFSYDNKTVLDNFSLNIKRGQVIAFVGESGSGKSTVVNLLQRFMDPEKGQILIDGISIKNFRLDELRKNIAVVTQDVFLFNDSIAYNIQSGDFTESSDKVEWAAKNAFAHGFIVEKQDSYNTKVGDRGGMLSGGERQRVSIARAFLKNAPLLILDEATSALDSASEVEVQKSLDSLMQGRTVLVVAHRLSTVVKADKIIVMKNGRIIEQGTHSELVELKGEYDKFRQLQSAE